MAHINPDFPAERLYYLKRVHEGKACPVCERLFGDDKLGLKAHLRSSHTRSQIREARKSHKYAWSVITAREVKILRRL